MFPIPGLAGGILSSMTVSGVMEEAVAGLIVALLVALATWQSGREAVITLGARVIARLGVYLEWSWRVHPFHKAACAWWLYMMMVSCVDTYVVPVGDVTYNVGAAWIAGVFGILAILWIRRRFTNHG